MDRAAPPIDARSEADLRRDLAARLAGFLPGWTPAAGDPAAAVADIFAHFAFDIVKAINDGSSRAQMGFLDACGERRLPAQAARVPLVFTLAPEVAADATLLEGTVVAARAAGGPGGAAPPLFMVESSVTLARARLAAVYSVDPASDRWTDHSAHLATGFAFFDRASTVEHAVYLGHDQLFRLPDVAHLILSFGLVAPGGAVREDLRLKWEYLAEGGWHPLDGAVADMLITDGQVDLRKADGPPSKQARIYGRQSYWVRGRVENPLPPGGEKGGALPSVDTVRASLDYGRDPATPDQVLVDGLPVQPDGTIYPFGRMPALGATLHIGCADAFSRVGARVRVAFNLRAAGAGTNAGRIAWEYYDGKNWRPLPVSDNTSALAPSGPLPLGGLITFGVPSDLAATEVGGIRSHFIRARLVIADPYGAPVKFVPPADPTGGTISPPVIDGLVVSYSLVTNPVPVDHCLTSNDFVFEDNSETARSSQGTFLPFRPVPDRQPAIVFGFDAPLPAGRLSLYVEVAAPDLDSLGQSGSSFIWEYFSRGEWVELGVDDGTQGFRQSGLIQFVGPFDAEPSPGVGGDLRRIRARLKQGARLAPLAIGGLWWNAVLARQAGAFPDEPLGHSDGSPRQLFQLPETRTPVLDGETLEVREWAGTDAGYEDVLAEVAAADADLEKDGITGNINAVWVRWAGRAHLFSARPHDRVYTIERATGTVRFGDGMRGRIPPAGAPMRLSYRSGGGAAGNVAAGALTEVRAPIPFIEKVANPRPARGGADVEPLETTMRRGPERLRHRDRALAARDFEWLALEASPAVARARCLPVAGPAGQTQRGWVTVVVVPKGTEPRPTPDQALALQVERFLGEHVPVSLARRVRVIGPEYLPISVIAEVLPLPGTDVASVGAALRRRLDSFLHPVTGGPEGRGFAVGQGLFVSQIAEIIESTAGVDTARRVSLQASGSTYVDTIPGRPGVLVAAGDHEILMTLRGDC